MENIIDPKLPLKVLFGLIFVNFGPLNILPQIKPAISEVKHVNKTIIKKDDSRIFSVKLKKIKLKKNRYMKKIKYRLIFQKMFLKIIFTIFANSKNANTEIIIKKYTMAKSIKNMPVRIAIRNNEVATLFLISSIIIYLQNFF